MLCVLEYIDGFVAGEISEIEVHISIDKKIGGSDVAVVDVENLVAGEDGEYHLVDHPNCISFHVLF